MPTEKLKNVAKQEAEELEQGFDEAVKEEESNMAEVNILGKAFEVPKAMPGWVNFFIGKYGTGKNKDVPPERYLEFIVRVCGDEISDHIIDNAPNDMDTQELADETVEKIKAVWEDNAKKNDQ
jgi:hypothetical protein